MKLLILFVAISRLCTCSLVIPVAYQGVTIGITPYSAPVNTHSQYHAQDKYGQYSYGYATDLSAQDEVKTADGITRGGYSYIDANGILQTVQYISDPVHGFRVAATNLPRDVPAVAAARAQHLAQFEYIKAEHAAIAASRGELPAIISPVPAPGRYIVPVRSTGLVVTAPESFPIAYRPPVIAISSQYQAQDGHGQYSYGYADPNSAKTEVKTADGVTRGGYSYIDANGVLQTVQYISDPVNGFRVAATNLPQAPSVTLIGPKVTATVVGPKEPTVSFEQRPIVVGDIIPNANIPVSVSPGLQIHPNPNNGPVAVTPNSELPPPFYSGEAPIHHQQPTYATAYPLPHPDGRPFVAPIHPSQVLQAPEYHSVPPNHREQILVSNQYAPEHRNVYENPNIQVSDGYNVPQTILVTNPRDQILLSNGQYVPARNGGIYGNIQPTQDQQAQILADVRGQILAYPQDQNTASHYPQNQVIEEQYSVNDASQHSPVDPRSQILGTNQRGQILIDDSQAHILNSDAHGRALAADPSGQSFDTHGQVVAEDPRIRLLSSDANGQILIADPRVAQDQILPTNPYGQIQANNPNVLLATNSHGQILSDDSRDQIHFDPRTQSSQQNHILSANPYEEIRAEIPNGQAVAYTQGQSFADSRGQTFSDQRAHDSRQGQIPSADPREHEINGQGRYYSTDVNVPNGYHPISLNPASRDYGANYPIEADTINNGPINQQVLNQGEGRVELFVPDGEAQQVQQGALGDAQVAGEQIFVGSNAGQNSHDGHVTPTSPSGYYTKNIQY